MAEFYTDINKEVFEEKIRGMFDSIWDCEIDHPMYQDTVGELMGEVIALWDNCHSTVSSSVQSKIEPLTDEEQRIFLSAMKREKEICEKIDKDLDLGGEEYYFGSRICKEIERKVKGTLWT